MSPNHRLKCGVAGVGYLGRHHARIYHSLEQVELVGLFEPDDGRANEVCREYGCRRFDSLEALGEACEAISVVVPTDRHCEVAIPLLAASCHLLIEKPLCSSAAEA